MTVLYADAVATEQHPFNPLLSWLLPSAGMIAGLIGAAFLAASLGFLDSRDGEAVAAPEIPTFGSYLGASADSADPWLEPFPFVADATGG